MKMLNVAVCYEQWVETDSIIRWIREFFEKSGTIVNIEDYSGGRDFVSNYVRGKNYHIIFMEIINDVAAGTEKGLEEVRKIRELVEMKDAQIILVSRSDFSIRQGAGINFVECICGSFGEYEIKCALKKAEKEINKINDIVHIKTGRRYIRLRLSDIEYIESQGRKLFVSKAGGGNISFYGCLEKLYNSIIQKYTGFYKIYRSVIVNLRYIEEIAPDYVKTMTGIILPVSRKYYKNLVEGIKDEM